MFCRVKNPTTHERVSEQALRFTRDFDAPPDRVLSAHIDPALFVRWMGPRGTTVELDRFDARTGGAFRYTVVGKSGRWTFFGAYHHVGEGRIAHTWQSANDTRPTFELLTFEARGAGCRLEGLSLSTSSSKPPTRKRSRR
jgi:uncharacterized protein YndB with AHSA1/START domain